MLSLLLAFGLALASPHVDPAPAAPPAPEVTGDALAQAEARFDQGTRSVRTSQHLLWGGSAMTLVGGAVGFVGLLGAAFDGGDGYVVAAIGGGTVAVGGVGMVAASPAVVARGLHLERQALAEVGLEADRTHARAARATGIGAAAAGLFVPGAMYGAAVSSVSFSVAQHRVNERTLATVKVAPEVHPAQVGLRLHGSF